MKTIRLFALLIALFALVSCHKSYEDRLKECDSVGKFKDGYALCVQEDIYFFIDETGKKRSEKYVWARDFCNGYALAQKRDKSGEHYCTVVLDKDCKEKYCVANVFGDVNIYGNLWVTMTGQVSWGSWSGGGNSHWQLLNLESGSFLTSMVEHIDNIADNGMTVASRQTKKNSGYIVEYSLIDGKGNAVVPFGTYSFIGNYHCGMSLYSTTGYYRYSSINDYDKSKEGLICLVDEYGFHHDNQRLGYINLQGKIVVPEQFTRAESFSEVGYARAWIKYNAESTVYNYIVDTKGRLLSGKEYSLAEASYLQDGDWCVGQDDAGSYFLANNKGVIKEIEKDVPLSKVGKYVAAKKRGTYEIYQLKKDDVEHLCTINGTGNKYEVLLVGSDERTFELFYNRQYNIYTLSGQKSGTTGIYGLRGSAIFGSTARGKAVISSQYENAAFVFPGQIRNRDWTRLDQ